MAAERETALLLAAFERIGRSLRDRVDAGVGCWVSSSLRSSRMRNVIAPDARIFISGKLIRSARQAPVRRVATPSGAHPARFRGGEPTTIAFWRDVREPSGSRAACCSTAA